MWEAVAFLVLLNIQFNTGVGPTFLQEPSSKSAIKATTATFDCQIDVSQPSYRWQKDGSNITKGSISLFGSVSSLQIDNLEFSDSGNYSCIATDRQSGQSGERTGTLVVKGKPSILLKAPSSSSTYVGQSAVFHCVVVGDPDPVVHWKNSSNSVITSGGRFEVFSNGTLEINNLLKTDDGSLYTCEAVNSYGTTAASATLRVNDPPVPPSFTTTPVNKTALEGRRETFYCAADGIPPPTITWSKLGGIITADRREEPSPGALRIINLQPEDDGVYVCTAQNILGNRTTQAFLHIQGYPRITTAPSDKMIRENLSVLFSCIIEGTPTPHVEWITPNGTIFTLLSQPSGTTRVLSNNSLHITMVTESDAGRYTCKAVNNNGERSASAILTVQTPPRFSTPLMNKTQNVNSQLVVECGAYGIPVPEYQWIFNGSIVTRDRSLNLSSLRPIHQGFYMCIANNSLGSANGRFYLSIQVPPIFTKSPMNQTIPKGQTAWFPCSATGDPLPSIKWFKSQDSISNDLHFSVLSNGTLVINSVSEQDSGWFTCRATNDAGSEEKKAYLLVADLPVFTIVPSNITADEGDSVTLPCRASAADKPQITWMLKDSSGLLTNIVPSASIQLGPSGDLTYTSVKSDNRGKHICKACNAAGCKSVDGFLNVLFAPRFLVPPKDVYALKGETAVLECKPESSPPATITWLKDGANLPGTGNQFSVDDVRAEDEGDYTCKARNSRGSTQEVVKLSIGTKAEIKDFKQTSSQLNKIRMQCIVGGIPPPKVTWYLQNTKLPYKQTFPDYDVNSNDVLIIPQASLVNNSFLCNCTNPLDSVARFARIPEAPSQVSVITIMETSLQVSWRQTDPLDLILQYMVQVKSGEEDWEQVNDTVQGTSVLVKNLNAFTGYSFRVRAKNGLGTSPHSQPSPNATTLEGAPSPPRELRLTVKNASVILMSWSRPDVLNGYLRTILYKINYTPVNGNTSKESFIKHSSSGSPQNFTLQGLSPDTVYNIEVYAGRRRNDGVERWSKEVLKTVTTLQLVPLTPPLDLTVQSNGAYQVMVKWKVPSYSIAGYHIWYGQFDGKTEYKKVVISRMPDTVYLITGLEPGTKYEVKARMYSNAGIGPFSELQFVTTSVDTFAVTSEQSGGTQSSGLKVAIICLLLGVILLLVIIGFVCFKRRQSRRSRQSFRIDNREDPSLKYVVQHGQRNTSSSRSQASTSGSSQGSVEGQYNFAVEDDEIDEGMFADDSNAVSYHHDPGLSYLDPARLNHDTPSVLERSVDDVIRLENYKPRISPSASRKSSETVYADIEYSKDNKRKEALNDFSKGSDEVTKPGPSNDDLLDSEPPNWVPPPPPVNMKEPLDDENRRTSPDKLVGGSVETSKYCPSADGPSSSEDSLGDDYVTLRETEPPQYPQGDRSAKMKNESTAQGKPGPSNDDLLDSEPPNWVPPPPPVNMKEPPEGESRTSPDKLVESSDETYNYRPSADELGDDYVTLRETESPQYPQGDRSAKMKSESTAQGNSVDSAKTEPLADRSSFHSEDASEDDDTIEWPPPPPPPQKSSYQPDDLDWERPLPPEIIALPGKRNRVASWARDEAEGSSRDSDDFSKI